MEKEFKSSNKRLVNFFKQSRDNWKDRSIKYQKEKREMAILIRDLRRSKEKWKSQCSQLHKEIADLKKKREKTKELLKKLQSL
jgi:uncharacterized protein YlxW (UPF0749 family)